MSTNFGFPTVRMRRLRHHPAVRRLIRETTISPAQLILPLFVRSGRGIRQPISSRPGQFQLSIDQLVVEIREIKTLGIGGVILFGIPAEKDISGSDSYSDGGIVQQAIRAI